MAYMESIAMVAAVQCDGNGSICFSCAAKVDPACQVPRITNHATTFGSICCLKQPKKTRHTVAVCGHRIVTSVQADLQQLCADMCACCLANFLMYAPYQACRGSICQAWRHTHMLERRATQALQPQQCTMPAGFWGMPPPAPPPNK